MITANSSLDKICMQHQKALRYRVTTLMHTEVEYLGEVLVFVKVVLCIASWSQW